jgi:hypothetical protein
MMSKNKRTMKVFSPDRTELMEVHKIERIGDNLVLHGKIMGSLPMKAVIRPDQARKGLSLLNFKTFLFLVTFLFRSSKSSG